MPPAGNAMELFVAGETDAFLGFPPEPQELRARGFDRVILEHGHRPAVVAVLLLHDLRQPRLGARSSGRDQALPARGLQGRRRSARPSPRTRRAGSSMAGSRSSYDYALQTIRELPYELWHEYDSEDSLRFYALRLHEAGMISIEPERAPRRRHRLALRQRAQARAEGVSMAAGWIRSARRLDNCAERRLPMQIIQSRRDFLASASFSGRRRGRPWRPEHRSPTRGRRRRPRSG